VKKHSTFKYIVQNGTGKVRLDMQVIQARFRIFKDKTPPNKGFLGNVIYTVHLYKIQDNNQTLHLLATRKMRICDEGWQEFDITEAGRTWFENSTNNYGLAMSVVSPSNHYQSPASEFGFVVNRRGPASKHPFYAAFYKRKDQCPIASSKLTPE